MAKVIDAILTLKDNFTVTMNKATKSMELSAKQAQRTGKQIQNTGKSLGGIGSALTKGVTVPILATGADLLKLASSFEEAEDKIRAGTGKTGTALNNLMNDFKSVYSSVPTSMDETSEAVTGLSQRLNLSGQPLQDISKQVLRLTKLTGTDLATVIQSSSRMLQDAGVKQQDYAKVLDYTYKVHQQTGVGLDVLQQEMAQFGSPLRQMGFDWQTSAAMLGKFEKEGVNTDLVVGSLRIALGKMAKAGVKNPAQAFEVMVKQIKNAGTAGKANALALQYFGAKAGPDMAAAIREGHLDLDGLLKTLKSSPDTINKAAAATVTPMERLKILGHQIQVALEPAANSLLTAAEKFEPMVTKMVGKVKEFADWLSKLTPKQQEMALKLLAIAAATGPVIKVISGITTNIGRLVVGFGKMENGIKQAGGVMKYILSPGHMVVLAIVAISAAIILVIKYWPQINAFIENVKKGVQGLIGNLNSFKNNCLNQIGGAVQTVKGKFNDFRNMLEKNQGTIKAVAAVLGVIFGPALIKTGIQAAVAGGKIAVTFVGSIIKTGAQAVVSGAKLAASFVASVVKSGVQAALAAPKIIGSFVAGIVKTGIESAKTAVTMTGKLIVAIVQYAAQGWKAVASIVATSAAWVAQKAVIIASAVATKAAAASQWLLNAAMNANPIGVVIALVLALVAAFVILWNKCKPFRDFWISTFNAIANGFKGFVNLIITGLDLLIGGLNKLKISVPSWVPLIGGKTFGFNIPQIPHFETGTSYFQGGPAIINERGGELVDLPNGSRVIPADKTNQILSKKSGNNYYIYVTGNSVRSDEDCDRIATLVVKKLKTAEANC
ncbi:MAG TPA: phage tail tape measure protein [Caproiciproducens sp.]|nr:phage tail tape measure protein [Caproiciproducens sp.]